MADDDGFISLPPGLVDADSGTHRRPRPERTERIPNEEIVFLSGPPGKPLVPPASVQPATAPALGEPPTAKPTPADPTDSLPEPLPVDEATRISASRHGKPSWRLTIPGIDVPVSIEGALFLGRNPTSTPQFPGASVLAITDPAKSVSKTHALLEVDAGQLWVHDLDSSNGVWVVPADGDAVEVVPGTRQAVPAGADLELGEVVIRVEHG